MEMEIRNGLQVRGHSVTSMPPKGGANKGRLNTTKIDITLGNFLNFV